MATLAPEKLKLPGMPAQVPASTTNPTFTSPQIQTAADVRQSQTITGNTPAPKLPESQPTPENPQAASIPKTPNASLVPQVAAPSVGGATTSSGASPQAATVPTATGAPPGIPQTTPSVQMGLAPTAKSLQGHNAAENEWIQAQNERDQKVYEAALAYNGGPTGALQTNQRAAEAGLRNATDNRGAAGTIESSLFGEDKGRIATNQSVANTKAYITYQEAVNAANQALTKAQIVYARAGEQEKREMAEAAEKKQPTEPINPPAPGSIPATPGNPAAQREVNKAFPGGINEQRRWIKEHAHYAR